MLYNIEDLVWDEWNKEHIKKHEVTILEVGEACWRPIKIYRTYKNRLIILGRTKKDRKLAIVLAKQDGNLYYVITARSMSRKERRTINEK